MDQKKYVSYEKLTEYDSKLKTKIKNDSEATLSVATDNIKKELIGSTDNESSANTIYGAKVYCDELLEWGTF